MASPGQFDRLSRQSLTSAPPKSAPSDLANTFSSATSLSGALPYRKRRYSFFDRIGSRMWNTKKGQDPNSYA